MPRQVLYISIHVSVYYFTNKLTVYGERGEFLNYASFQPYLIIYGGQLLQLEEHIVLGSEPATFN